MPNAIKAIAPRDAPSPIPAFAPVESPPFPVLAAELEAAGAGCAIDAEGEDIEVNSEAVEAGVEAGVEAAVEIVSPKRLAIVCRGTSLPSAQQALLPPQHHVVDDALLFPSQEVTTILSFR